MSIGGRGKSPIGSLVITEKAVVLKLVGGSCMLFSLYLTFYMQVTNILLIRNQYYRINFISKTVSIVQ